MVEVWRERPKSIERRSAFRCRLRHRHRTILSTTPSTSIGAVDGVADITVIAVLWARGAAM
jgi:hypothetical protein